MKSARDVEPGDTPPPSKVTQRDCVGSRLYRADSVLAGETLSPLSHDAAAALHAIATWLDGHVSRPHPALGRSGEVCPWTRRTMELGKLLLTTVSSDDVEEADAVLIALLERFLSMPPTQGADASFRSMVAIFHRLDSTRAEEFVVALHTRLKPRFLERGLMLGEFYPTCDKPGLRNPAFRPLRSPIPLLVIRQMVEADIEFLLDRDEFVEAYLKTLRVRGAERLARVLRETPASVEPERLPALARRAAVYLEGIRTTVGPGG